MGPMIVLFTDFGPSGLYVGQMRAVLARDAPGIPVIELCNDAPTFDPMASAYLLAAYASAFPAGAVFLGVVDPGVGSSRVPLALEADGRWYVGPDNGLFALIFRRAAEARCWAITWRAPRLSPSFHGRDLFAPVAARLARGEKLPGDERVEGPSVGAEWPDDLARVIHVDHFGNAITGVRASQLSAKTVLTAAGRHVERARTFSDVAEGQAFWYENANGLAEIAVNCGRADAQLGLTVGAPIDISGSGA